MRLLVLATLLAGSGARAQEAGEIVTELRKNPCPEGSWPQRSYEPCAPIVCGQVQNEDLPSFSCPPGHHAHTTRPDLSAPDKKPRPLACLQDYSPSNEERLKRPAADGSCEPCVQPEHGKGLSSSTPAFRSLTDPSRKRRTLSAPAPQAPPLRAGQPPPFPPFVPLKKEVCPFVLRYAQKGPGYYQAEDRCVMACPPGTVSKKVWDAFTLDPTEPARKHQRIAYCVKK